MRLLSKVLASCSMSPVWESARCLNGVWAAWGTVVAPGKGLDDQLQPCLCGAAGGQSRDLGFCIWGGFRLGTNPHGEAGVCNENTFHVSGS